MLVHAPVYVYAKKETGVMRNGLGNFSVTLTQIWLNSAENIIV